LSGDNLVAILIPYIMTLKNVLPISAMMMTLLMVGCSNEMDTGMSSRKTAVSASVESLKAANSLIPAVKQPPLAVIVLGHSGNFAILSKSGITDVYKSTITGDVGASPITGAAILLTCPEVNGTIYSVNAAGPLPCRVINPSMLTTAVNDMQTAYVDAAGREKPSFLNLGAGNIGGLTLAPGLYKWTTAVVIPTDVTISGGLDDVFIFQIAETLKISSAVKVTLTGGVQAKNIFWQVAGAVTLGTTSHFEGNVMGKTGINLQTGATINGRLLAQTAVTLEKNTVTIPN
jgi:Ice-binding-like